MTVSVIVFSCHVETVVLLRRENVDGYVGIDLDVENLNSKSGTATYEDVKAYIAEKYGFKCVTTGYTIIDLTPDGTKYPKEMAEAMIEEGRQSSLEAKQSVYSDHADKVISAVNNKYDERLRLYRAGKKQWDTTVSVTMIVRGIK